LSGTGLLRLARHERVRRAIREGQVGAIHSVVRLAISSIGATGSEKTDHGGGVGCRGTENRWREGGVDTPGLWGDEGSQILSFEGDGVLARALAERGHQLQQPSRELLAGSTSGLP